MYIYIYGHPPPHDRPRPSKHRSHRHVRAFSGVSSLSPPNVSVKNHPTTETKKTKKQISTENAGTVLVFCFFGFLVLCFFVFLFFWFFGFLFFLIFCVFWLFGFIVERVIFQKTPKTKKTRTKQPKNQRTKKPKNQITKKPKTKKTKKQKTKEPKKQKTKTVPAFSVELWFFGFLVSVVGWFFTDTFGGLKLDTPEKAD